MFRHITFSALLLCITLLFVSCENEVEPIHTYTKIFFNRDGGGNKSFYITNTSDNEIIMNVTRYNFRDTNYTKSVFIEDEGRLSNLISKVIKNKINLKGDYKQPDLLTGTWSYFYVVDDENNKTEITNTSIRDSLMVLEVLLEVGR